MNSVILGIGTGRDGTTSLSRLIEDIFRVNAHGGQSVHQQDHRLLYNELAKWKECGKSEHREAILSAIRTWRPGNAIVGNGYAHVTELIHEIHGERVKLIHLVRNKDAWMKSFLENIRTFPWSHGNYAECEAPRIQRVTAYHYDEMSREAWCALPIEDKVSWYYDKSHAAARAARDLFPDYLEVPTESLSTAEGVATITRFLSPEWTAPKTGMHVNASGIDYESLSDDDRVTLNRFYQDFDYLRAANHPLEGEDYFAQRAIRGFINRDAFDHSTVSPDELREYGRILETRLDHVKRLLSESGDV
jgi:hypothetical protein